MIKKIIVSVTCLLLVSGVIGGFVLLFAPNQNFGAGLRVSTTATSTFPDGINIQQGCFTIAGGNCITSSSGTILYSSSGRQTGAVIAMAALPSTGLGLQGKIRVTGYCATNGDHTMNARIGTGAASTTIWTLRNSAVLVEIWGFATSTSGQNWSAASTSQALNINTESYYSNSSQLYFDVISTSAGSYCEGLLVERLNT